MMNNGILSRIFLLVFCVSCSRQEVESKSAVSANVPSNTSAELIAVNGSAPFRRDFEDRSSDETYKRVMGYVGQGDYNKARIVLSKRGAVWDDATRDVFMQVIMTCQHSRLTSDAIAIYTVNEGTNAIPLCKYIVENEKYGRDERCLGVYMACAHLLRFADPPITLEERQQYMSFLNWAETVEKNISARSRLDLSLEQVDPTWVTAPQRRLFWTRTLNMATTDVQRVWIQENIDKCDRNEGRTPQSKPNRKKIKIVQ